MRKELSMTHVFFFFKRLFCVLMPVKNMAECSRCCFFFFMFMFLFLVFFCPLAALAFFFLLCPRILHQNPLKNKAECSLFCCPSFFFLCCFCPLAALVLHEILIRFRGILGSGCTPGGHGAGLGVPPEASWSHLEKRHSKRPQKWCVGRPPGSHLDIVLALKSQKSGKRAPGRPF